MGQRYDPESSTHSILSERVSTQDELDVRARLFMYLCTVHYKTILDLTGFTGA